MKMKGRLKADVDRLEQMIRKALLLGLLLLWRRNEDEVKTWRSKLNECLQVQECDATMMQYEQKAGLKKISGTKTNA